MIINYIFIIDLKASISLVDIWCHCVLTRRAVFLFINII